MENLSAVISSESFPIYPRPLRFATKAIARTDCPPMGDPDPAVMDAKFRFALNFAINRQQLIDKVYQGAGEPGTTIVPPTYTQWQWQPDDPCTIRAGQEVTSMPFM